MTIVEQGPATVPEVLTPGDRVRIDFPGNPAHGRTATVLANAPSGWSPALVAHCVSLGRTTFVDFGGEFGYCRGAYHPSQLSVEVAAVRAEQ